MQESIETLRTELEGRLRFETLLPETSARFVNLPIGMVEGGEIVFKTMGAAPPGDDLFQNCEAVRLIAGRQGLVGWAAGTGEPVLVQDVDMDPRFVAAQDDRTRSEAAIPIKIKGAVIGVLGAESDRVNGFDDSDMIVLQSLADQVAVAIENARLYEHARDVAALEERQKLARELHDSVSQALYGIVLGARTARTQLDRDPAKAAEPLEYILSLSEAGLAEMRALIFELRPESLQTEGMVAALGRLVNALGARYQLGVHHRHRPIDLLRYAGLFTWLCPAIPLVLMRVWYVEPLEHEQYIAWWILHLVFGFTYWNQVRALPVRTGLAHRLLIVSVLTVSALGVSVTAETSLGGILLLIVAGILPWILSLAGAVAWLVGQNVLLVLAINNIPDIALSDALLTGGLFLGRCSPS